MSEDEFYCGDDEEKPLNQDMIECSLCGKEVLKMRSNNPLPLIHSDDEEVGRCCTSCNSYVTAARMLLPRNMDPFVMADTTDGMVRFIRMANSMRIAQEQMRENLDQLSKMI